MTGDQLRQLAKPFRADLVETKPGKFAAAYVKHGVVAEKLLAELGGYDYSIDQLIRGEVAGCDGTVVVGCLATLTLCIDGTTHSVTEVGDCEQPGNWPHDGARSKDAASDAFKRCAMRFGVGLHLWTQSDRLYRVLSSRIEEEPFDLEPKPVKLTAKQRADRAMAQVADEAASNWHDDVSDQIDDETDNTEGPTDE